MNNVIINNNSNKIGDSNYSKIEFNKDKENQSVKRENCLKIVQVEILIKCKNYNFFYV